MVFWDILKWALKKKKKREERVEEQHDPRKAELEEKWRRLEELNREIDRDYQRAVEYLKAKLPHIKDPIVREAIRTLIEDLPTKYQTLHYVKNSHKIPTIVAADAVKKGKHTDPYHFTAYTAAHTIKLTKKLVEEFQGLKAIDYGDSTKADELLSAIHPTNTLYMLGMSLLEAGNKNNLDIVYHPLMVFALETDRSTYADGWTRPEIREEEERRVQEPMKTIEDFLKGGAMGPYENEARYLLEHYKRYMNTPLHQLAEDYEAPPTTTGARELLKLAVSEQLPGWVTKTALDQAKIPLYTTPQGVHPSIVSYHIQRSDPTDPKGTLLHGIITTILSQWEREAASGEKPTHPHEIIARYTRISGEEEARRIANELGLPQNTTPQTLERVLRELERDLEELKQGKDPHQLDAEKEAALRYHQLKPLADKAEPHPDIERIIEEGKTQLLQTYNELKNQILAETQLGREEQEKTLNIVEKILEENLDKITGRPLAEAVTEITRQAEERLQQEGIRDPQQRAWATNLLRNILIDAPIIAAARNPRTQYLPLEEKRRIAADLLKYYESYARRHTTAPVAADLHEMWKRVVEAGEGTEDPKREMLEAIERIRNSVNAMGNVTRLAYNMYRPLLSAENFIIPPSPGREGFLDHKVISDLYEIKRRLIEGTYPRISKERV